MALDDVALELVAEPEEQEADSEVNE